MDPNEALKVIRELADGVVLNRPEPDAALRLAEHVQALDEWLSAGGFLPAEWRR